MTLLLTAATPDGIVLGADSALTFTDPLDEIALTDFPKIIPLPRLHLAISLAGQASIDVGSGPPVWMSTWLRDFVHRDSAAESFTAFCDELVEALNALPPGQGLNAFHCAAWALASDDGDAEILVPCLSEVSNPTGTFTAKSLISPELAQEMVAWRAGVRDHGYPLHIMSAGIPMGYSTWLREEGIPAFSKLVGGSVPPASFPAVVEFVRFAITAVGQLHRIARKTGYVGEPVETMMLFPTRQNMFSVRY